MNTLDVIKNLRTGKLDLQAYLTSLCNRIESEDHRLRAMVPDTFDRQSILDQGSQRLEQYPKPDSRPPLFGVPIGVKDIFRVAGFKTRCGTALPAELFEGAEAHCVSRLKAAGAIVMGKTVTTEFAFFEPGPTRNPRHLDHTPGGSSSGSAAGVGAEFFPFALGTQTVGSTIRPAAYCGIVGFKPSFGRISTSGVIPFSQSADHVGLFCNDVFAMEAFLSTLVEDWQPLKKNVAVVLGVPEGPYLEQATAKERDHFDAQLEVLYRHGYAIKRIQAFSNIADIIEDHMNLIAAEAARIHAAWFKAHRPLYSLNMVEIIERGMAIADEQLKPLRRKRLNLRANLEQIMTNEGIDYWMCPSAPDQAPKGLESTGSPLMNLPWTSAGLPAISLPTWEGSSDLPHGLQVVGAFEKDEQLIADATEISKFLKQ